MKIQFDHVVHAVHNLHALQSQIGQIGLTPSIGGRHEQWGTANSLSYFDLTYIEWLTVDAPQIAAGLRDNALVVQTVRTLARHEGFVAIALRTDSLADLQAKFVAEGYPVEGPVEGQRTRADGSVLRWSMLFPHLPPAQSGTLPFFIEWANTDEDRRMDLAARNLLGRQQTDLSHLDFVAIAVEDAEAAAKHWTSLFQFELQEGWTLPQKLQDDWKANAVRLHVPGCDVVFCSPSGPGKIADILREKGACAVHLQIGTAHPWRIANLFGASYGISGQSKGKPG